MAGKIRTYLQAIAIKVAIWVRRLHPCAKILHFLTLIFSLVSSFMGSLDVERPCWLLQWQRNVV